MKQRIDPDKTLELTPLQSEVLLLALEQEAERQERIQGLKPPHKSPASFPKMPAVLVGLS